ncbi:MAG: 30S ribosomal protein S8 [Oligoflexia bacterium]|nr:30S ribosomal protein S8 [Oligoflexia bacterium]
MDPIADLLTRIRNASSAKHDKVDVPYSAVKEGIVNVLKSRGLVKNFRVVKDNRQGMMRIYLKYDNEGTPVLTHLKRESRPGLRKYIGVDEIPSVRTGFGVAVLSTSHGIMSGDEAKEKRFGGEYICSVW